MCQLVWYLINLITWSLFEIWKILKKIGENKKFWEFFPLRGGGSPIPKSICQNSYQKVNILMKTKNAPKDLKCKINDTFFFETGVPKRGEGGGGARNWGKFPKNPVFFCLERPLCRVPKSTTEDPHFVVARSDDYHLLCIWEEGR